MPNQNNRPFFSVIVPVYNVENYVENCVENILNQTFQNFELIIVNDGSTDSSAEVIQRTIGVTGSKSPKRQNQPQPSIISHIGEKVKLISQKNQGLSAARNTGIKEARGDYLVFVDGDDYLELDALEKMAQALDDTRIDILRFQAQDISENRENKWCEPGFETMSGIEAFKKLEKCHYTENAWLYAYRRDFWARNGFMFAEGKLVEDFGLIPYVIAKANQVKAIPDILYDYRQRKGSIIRDNNKLSQRIADAWSQIKWEISELEKIKGAEYISRFLVISFFTAAAKLPRDEFLGYYRKMKREGLAKYIYPLGWKSLPRTLILKFIPSLFYRLFNFL